MEPITFLLIWSLFGVIPWQLIYLKRWAKSDPNRSPYEMDILQAIPFGLVVLLAILITWYLSIRKEKSR